MSAPEKSPSANPPTVDDAAPVTPTPDNNKTAPITAVLAAAPSSIDAFIARLFRCLQTRSGADTVLMFICYTSRLSGSILELVARSAIRQSARRLVALAFKLPPATTVVMSSATPRPSLAAKALQLSGHLNALSSLMSETRTVGRLWGLLALYFAAKGRVLKSREAAAKKKKDGANATQDSSEEQFDALVAWAKIISLIVFQACENAAFLGSKKILPLAPATQGRLGLLSVRSWGLYVAMEGAHLLVQRSRRQSSGVAAKDAEWREGWNKSFYRNLAWAPLTVHWGTPSGVLPDFMVGLLACYPAIGGMRDLWQASA